MVELFAMHRFLHLVDSIHYDFYIFNYYPDADWFLGADEGEKRVWQV